MAYRMFSRRVLWGLACWSLLGGCAKTPVETRFSLTDCPASNQNGVVVSMHNSHGDPISDATILAREGAAYEDTLSLTNPDEGEYQGVPDRAGSYTLQIMIPGRSDTVIGPLEVRPGPEGCGIVPVSRHFEFWP